MILSRAAFRSIPAASLTLAILLAAAGARPARADEPAAVPPAAHAMSHADSVQADKDVDVTEVLKGIAGRENVPADSVFKNIRVMKQVPAGRLVRIMDRGFARSLGVTCDHCHIAGHWADDDKKTKQIARDMMAMVHTINDSLLTAIPNLKSEKPVVNCTTCHRGQVKPATDL